MNNQGAEEFPDDMLSYLKTESQHTAILGPLKPVLIILTLKFQNIAVLKELLFKVVFS